MSEAVESLEECGLRVEGLVHLIDKPIAHAFRVSRNILIMRVLLV